MIPNSDVLAISTGMYEHSKLILARFDFESCEFHQIDSRDLEKNLFGEGISLVADNKVF
jgi:glutamine cyclotransferase